MESHERSHLDRGSSEKHEPSFLPLHDNSRRPLSLFFSSQFDDDFYEFRCSIKELERRLGAVVSLAFDDCATVYGRFKLLDSFEGLLERPIIQVLLQSLRVSTTVGFHHRHRFISLTYL